MKVYELLESLYYPSQYLKKLGHSKDELITHILQKVKDGNYNYAKKMVALARDKGMNYPEFDAIEKSIGKGVAGNATHEPTYNERGQLHGRVKDWHTLMGVKAEDIPPAVSKIHDSKEYKKLLSLGFKEKTSATQKKNGTFDFIHPKEVGGYQVYANGQLRRFDANMKHQLIPSLKPIIVPDDPVQTLVKTYKAAMEKLHSYYTRTR